MDKTQPSKKSSARARNRRSFSRRHFNQLGLCSGLAVAGIPGLLFADDEHALTDEMQSQVKECRKKGLDWIAKSQSKLGHWSAEGTYYSAMTALAGIALTCSGSTTTQGPYAKNISDAVDFLLTQVKQNGLIGNPGTDDRYTYGHGFAMLFLSQVLGEEESQQRRKDLIETLQNAIKFSVNAQTKAGGWGYLSAKEGDEFDEGSTTITQVQGLRGCRNGGLTVPRKVIDNAIQYIYRCKNKDGGISYSSAKEHLGVSRPAITAASLATLYNAGEKENEHIPAMWKFAKRRLHSLADDQTWGHWHYTYLYYSQVVYRQGKKEWAPFRNRLYTRLVKSQKENGAWEGEVAPIYVTSCCLIMLQLELAYLPIFQR